MGFLVELDIFIVQLYIFSNNCNSGYYDNSLANNIYNLQTVGWSESSHSIIKAANEFVFAANFGFPL